MSQPYPPGNYGPPAPPPRRSTGKAVGIGCAGVLVLLLFGGCVAALSGSDDKTKPDPTPTRTTEAAKDDKPVKDTEPTKKEKTAEPEPEKQVVTFKVWGTAPNGALAPLDITYGSDSDTRKGEWKNGTFTATLPLDDDAMYYSLMAQLQGSGDINCSVTIDGHTEKAHASGGYNICHAQANSGLLGGWD